MPFDDVDRIIGEKDFHLLDDNDIATFLQNHRREDWKVDFKLEFDRSNDIVDKLKLCKNIVAFANQQGGLIVYGVSNDIITPSVPYPAYIHGCSLKDITPENLSSWIRSYISPGIYATTRYFRVTGKDIVVIKVPPGTNKPYCYYDSTPTAQIFFRRSTAQVHTLTPEETSAFYRECLLENARMFVCGAAGQAVVPTLAEELKSRIAAHETFVQDKLENTKEFGYLKTYCIPLNQGLILSEDTMADFVQQRKRYSETLLHSRRTETYQDRYSRGYFADGIDPNIKSSDRVTVYRNGLVVQDSQLDPLFKGDKRTNLWWISYQIQRTLQICYDVLHDLESEIYLYVKIENLTGFFIEISDYGEQQYMYTGVSEPIVRRMRLAEIYHDTENWNRTIPIIKDVILEICKMFGLSSVPNRPWDENDQLRYALVFRGTR